MDHKIQEIKQKTKSWWKQNLANLITSLGIVSSFLFLITAISEPKNISKIIIFAIFAAITDFADGPVARWLKTETILGSYLDRIRDRILIYPGVIILGFQYKAEIIFPEALAALIFSLFVFEALIFRIGAIGLWWHIKGKKLDLDVNDWGKRKIFTGFTVIFIFIGSLALNSLGLPALKYSIWFIYFGLGLMVHWSHVSWKEYQHREQEERTKDAELNKDLEKKAQTN
jgi:phosphatidylglycerophosphate synthase